jgi:hypothetical protein
MRGNVRAMAIAWACAHEDAPGDRGTEIHVDLEGSTPGGKLGEVV